MDNSKIIDIQEKIVKDRLTKAGISLAEIKNGKLEKIFKFFQMKTSIGGKYEIFIQGRQGRPAIVTYQKLQSSGVFLKFEFGFEKNFISTGICKLETNEILKDWFNNRKKFTRNSSLKKQHINFRV